MSIISGSRSDAVSVLLKSNDISAEVQKHLVSVLSCVTFAAVVAAVGSAAGLAFELSGLLCLVLGTLGALGLLYVLFSTERTKENVRLRAGAFIFFAFAEGLSITSVVRMLVTVSPALVVQAVAITVSVFLCFTLAALFARRRSYLFLIGGVSSCLTTLFVVSLVNTFFVRSERVFDAQLVVGLLLAVGMTAVETQIIVESASTSTDPDVLGDAARLFLDLLENFIRVALILLRSSRRGGGGGGGGGGVGGGGQSSRRGLATSCRRYKSLCHRP